MTSFNVTWKTNTKLAGKVFARKRKPINGNKNIDLSEEHTSNAKQFSAKLTDKKVVKHLNVKQKVSKEKNITNRREDTASIDVNDNTNIVKMTKLVKRKQKKDKLLAKLAADSQQSTAVAQSKPKDHSLFSVGNKNVYIQTNTKGKSVIEEVFSADKKFDNLNIHKYIVSNLGKIGFTTLTNVQEKSIPVILSGQNVLVSLYQPIVTPKITLS